MVYRSSRPRWLKKRPFYSINVCDSQRRHDSPHRTHRLQPDGRRSGLSRLNVNQERLAYWQSQGAQLSETVARLVKEAKGCRPEFLTESTSHCAGL